MMVCGVCMYMRVCVCVDDVWMMYGCVCLVRVDVCMCVGVYVVRMGTAVCLIWNSFLVCHPKKGEKNLSKFMNFK